MLKKILVSLDGSKVAEEVIPYVEDMAASMGAAMTIVRVSPRPQPLEGKGRVISTVEQTIDGITAHYKSYLEPIAARLRAKGIKTETVVLFGNPAEQIVDYAREIGADLIAMCTHGRTGIGRWVYGSVANHVLRSATTPLLMIRWSGAKHD